MHAPSWLLLFWSGFAATLAAAIVGTALGRGAPRAWALTPRPRTGPAAFGTTLFAGLVAYPALYGFLFEFGARAEIRTGLIAGSLHALIVFLLGRRLLGNAVSFRMASANLVYAVTLAFLYTTP